MSRRLLAVLTVVALCLAVRWLYLRTPEDAASQGGSLDRSMSGDEAGFEKALLPRRFGFPADHGAHPGFRTEWWYFTGNLKEASGRRLGYELTFFRFALTPSVTATSSAWRTNQLYMAHFALTDAENGRFYADERFARGANGLAGAGTGPFRVWLYDWSAASEKGAFFPLRLKASGREFSIDLRLVAGKPFVLQGENGLSRKSPKPGYASYYYSNTRMQTRGVVAVGGKRLEVAGESWMDREWSTSALAKEQIGWDWFALRLSDDTEIMYYRFRRRDGLPDPNSSGAVFLADGRKIPLSGDEVTIKVLNRWKSPHSGITYPSRWRLQIPSRNIELDLVPLIEDQELNLRYRYWEGAVEISGKKKDMRVLGEGYVEMTGYGE
ncbi:MAG: lipocalin-like domain-containing protein [Gammaproteobacteria bacterium]